MSTKIGLIYVITNKINNKKYVGFTTNLKNTIARHIHRAEIGHRYLLSNAIRKYKWKNFNVEVILESKDYKYVKDVMEPYFIKELNTFYESKHGYNMTLGGEGTFGYKRTLEEREKISKRFKGKKLSDERKKQISKATSGENNPNFGKHHSAETRAKISAANIGKPGYKWTEEQKRIASERRRGMKITGKWLENMKKAKALTKGKPGHPHTEEHKQYMSKILKGRIFSEKTKKKMSESWILTAEYISTIKGPDGKIYETCSVEKFAEDFGMCGDALFRSFKRQIPGKKYGAKGWMMISRVCIKGTDRSKFKEIYGQRGWKLIN